MGTNYYLKYKKSYHLGDVATLGTFDTQYAVQKLKNGYVWNEKYYKDLTALNVDYFQYIHIGKSSCGWHFALCIYPNNGINDIYDWKKLFENPENIIEDEYHCIITAEEMFSTITDRAASGWGKWTQAEWEQQMVDSENDFITHFNDGKKLRSYDELLRQNNAVRGIHGLWAHKPNSYTTYSDGTYDYINAEYNDFC